MAIIKISPNGKGRKNGFYFSLSYDSYLDGAETTKPWTVSAERHDEEGRVTQFFRSYRIYRFETKEQAAQFCDDIAVGKYSLDQLRQEEEAAEKERKQSIDDKNNSVFSTVLQEFKALGVDPMLLPEILNKVYSMEPEIRRMAANSETIHQFLQAGQKESLFDQISHAAARQVFPSLATPTPSRTNPEH